MLPGRAGRSLEERAANSGVRPSGDFRPSPAQPADSPAAPRAGDGGEGRHCWVRDPPDAPGTWPGLLVEWRQQADGWEGRVVYTVTGPRGARLVESWIPARWLEPR